ncbi:MAG: GyrI-like domain-containing protein, partial [Candidatus Adiutrix sp.]
LLPEGMQRTSVPKGLYAVCELKALSELPAAFTYLYSTWATANGFEPLVDLPSYEFYPRDYLKTKCFTINMPIKKKDG